MVQLKDKAEEAGSLRNCSAGRGRDRRVSFQCSTDETEKTSHRVPHAVLLADW